MPARTSVADGAGLGVRLLHVRRQDLHAAAEHRRREDDRRHRQQREQRQLRRRVEEQRRPQHAEHREPQRVGELLAEHVLQRRHVGRQPRRDLADVAAIEELDVLAQQRVEHQAAQPDADALGAQAEEVVARAGRHRLDEQDDHHPERQLIQPLRLAAVMPSSMISRITCG